jgi:2-phospho-L-lactate guanylyltransferase
VSIWAVVPLKALAAAKGRLAPVLTVAERAALARAMLADVLAALQASPGVAGMWVVSGDAAALELAERLGARPLEEPRERAAVPALAIATQTAGVVPRLAPTQPPAWGGAPVPAWAADAEEGLNAALDHAARVAEAAGATGLLALPADVPLVTPVDVAALLRGLPAVPAAVLAPTLDGGTGALLRSPPTALPARFGEDSLRAHLRVAYRRGVRTRVVRRANLALDLDRPADLQRIAALAPRSRTQVLLVAWRLRERLAACAASAGSADG